MSHNRRRPVRGFITLHSKRIYNVCTYRKSSNTRIIIHPLRHDARRHARRARYNRTRNPRVRPPVSRPYPDPSCPLTSAPAFIGPPRSGCRLRPLGLTVTPRDAARGLTQIPDASVRSRTCKVISDAKRDCTTSTQDESRTLQSESRT